MNINEMTMELLVKENEALKRANHSMATEINRGFDIGKATDIVWITRDEMKEYSDINQAGGINAIKADAIGCFVSDLTHTNEDGRLTVNFSMLHEYVNKLRKR